MTVLDPSTGQPFILNQSMPIWIQATLMGVVSTEPGLAEYVMRITLVTC